MKQKDLIPLLSIATTIIFILTTMLWLRFQPSKINKQIQPPSSITPRAIITPDTINTEINNQTNPIPTPNISIEGQWKVHTSEKSMYKVKYPKQWHFYDIDTLRPEYLTDEHEIHHYAANEIQLAGLGGPTPVYINTLSIDVRKATYTLNQIFDLFHNTSELATYEKTIIDSYPALKVTKYKSDPGGEDSPPNISYLVIKDGKIYTLYYDHIKSDPEIIDLIEQSISDFKFI